MLIHQVPPPPPTGSVAPNHQDDHYARVLPPALPSSRLPASCYTSEPLARGSDGEAALLRALGLFGHAAPAPSSSTSVLACPPQRRPFTGVSTRPQRTRTRKN